MKFENLYLIFTTFLGVFMLYFIFYIQNIAIRITLIFLVAIYIISSNWNIDKEGEKND
jgi:hypothetical protein